MRKHLHAARTHDRKNKQGKKHNWKVLRTGCVAHLGYLINMQMLEKDKKGCREMKGSPSVFLGTTD